jgi:hypothetical protein
MLPLSSLSAWGQIRLELESVLEEEGLFGLVEGLMMY